MRFTCVCPALSPCFPSPHLRLFFLKRGAGWGAGSALQVDVISVCLQKWGNWRTTAKRLCHGDRYPAMLLCTVSPRKSAGIWPLDVLNEISPAAFLLWIIFFCSCTDKPGPFSFKLDTVVWKRRWAAVPAHLSCTPTWTSGAIRAAFHDPGVWFPHFAALCLPCSLKEASVGWYIT